MRKSSASFLLASVLFWGIIFIACGEAQALPPLPDLAVSIKPTAFSGTILVGQNISSLVQPRVINGGQSAVSTYAIAVVLSTNSSIVYDPSPHASISTGRMIGQKVVTTSLLPGKSEVVTIKPVQIPENISWGQYFITVIVDPANKLAESTESNNKAQASCFILADAQWVEQGYSSEDVRIAFHGKGFGSWKNTLVARVGPYTIPTQSQNWSNEKVYAYPSPDLIPLGTQLYDWGLYDGAKAICRTKQEVWSVILTSANPASGPPGTQVQVTCCNCQSQGTKKLVLRNNFNIVVEVPVVSWTNGLVVGTIPNVPPAFYWFGVTDGGQWILHSWIASFTVK